MDKTGSHTKGVKVRGNAIQIKFKPTGETAYCYETMPWPATPANIIRAANLRAEIVEKIRYGVFNYADYFPDSPRAQITTGTFFDYAQAWLDDPTNDWTQQTRYKFKGILQRVWVPYLDGKEVRHISPGDITAALASAVADFKAKYSKDPSKSLFNDWLLCVRGVFATAVKAGALRRLDDPTQDLQNKTRDKTDPDPFDIHEANAIIAAAYASYGELTGSWFELGFYSGMRYPSEPAALTWADIDMRKGEARINKIMTKKGVQHTTKTGRSRILFLNSRSRNALVRLQAITGADGGLVFRNTLGGDLRHAKTERKVWAKLLGELVIRYRDMYNMRHTYATFGLMNGANPAFMASQLGHSVEEFFKTYAKWINSNQNQVQVELIERALELHESVRNEAISRQKNSLNL